MWPIFYDGTADTTAATSDADSSSSALSSPPASLSDDPTTNIDRGNKNNSGKDKNATTTARATIPRTKKAGTASTMLATVEAHEPNHAEGEPASKRRRITKAPAKKSTKEIAEYTKENKDRPKVPSAKALGKRKLVEKPEAADDEVQVAGPLAKRQRGGPRMKISLGPLNPAHAKDSGKAGASPSTAPDDQSKNTSRMNARAKLGPPKQEDTFTSKLAIKIPLSDTLKSILVDDWEQVTKNHALVPLPVLHPVNELLEMYCTDERTKRAPGTAEYDLLEETVHGIKEYFKQCLGKILLYKLERRQYYEMRLCWEGSIKEWVEKGKGPGDIYGGEHLLRLFCKPACAPSLGAQPPNPYHAAALPELIAQTNMDQQSVTRLREEVSKMAQWLSKNASSIFTVAYEPVSAEYEAASKGLKE